MGFIYNVDVIHSLHKFYEALQYIRLLGAIIEVDGYTILLFQLAAAEGSMTVGTWKAMEPRRSLLRVAHVRRVY